MEDWQAIIRRQKARQEAERARKSADPNPRRADEERERRESKAWLDQFTVFQKLQGIRDQVWADGGVITVDLVGENVRDRAAYEAIIPSYHRLYGYALSYSFEQAVRTRGLYGRPDTWSKRVATSSLGIFAVKDTTRGRLLVVHSVIPEFLDDEPRCQTDLIDVLDSKNPEQEIVELLAADCLYRQEHNRLPTGLQDQGKSDLRKMPRRFFGLLG